MIMCYNSTTPRLITSSTKGTQLPLLLTSMWEILRALKYFIVLDEPNIIACVFFMFNAKRFIPANVETFLAR